MPKSIVWFLLLMGLSSQTIADDYMIVCGKLIRVDGNTNIGSFSCEYVIQESYDTLFLSSNYSKRNNMAFSVQVPEFSCGNFILNKDFQNTLCAKKYPEIRIKVLNLNQHNNCNFSGSIELNLVGKKKVIRDLLFEEKKQKESSKLVTFFTIKASDFGITMPERFGGMITTDDCIEISVDLKVL